MPPAPLDRLALARVNVHPRDVRIRFDEAAHKYYIDGKRYPSSVSGLVHEYFPSFDAAATIERSYASWKRNKENKYYNLISYLTGVVGFSDELAKLEIARTWSAAGARASGAGTDTHLQIELCLNGEAHQADSPEFAQYKAWRETRPTWTPYRTEWSVFSEPELVCGQIDSLWVDEHGAHHMVDWKRVADMKTEGFRGECGLPPLHKLANSNYGHYVLQQNAYSWMLERCYGISVASMALVQVHPDLLTFREWPLPRIDAEVNLIMAARRERVAAGDLRVTDPGDEVSASASGKRKAEEAPAAEALRAHLRRVLQALEGSD